MTAVSLPPRSVEPPLPPQPQSRARTREHARAAPGVAAFAVWATWALMVVVAAGSVGIHGRDIPFAEDWFLVAPLTGNEPSLFEWLWTPNSEHLVVVPKAVYLLLLFLAGGDFRVGMALSVAVLGALSAGMLLTVRHLRGGRLQIADAFFPIVFLHLGHWDNLIWSWQLQFVLSTALICLLLLMVVGWRDGPPTAWSASAAALALLALPLSGGNGTVTAPAFALWMAYCGLHRVRQGRRAGDRIAAGILLAAAILALSVVGVYLLNYQRPGGYPASPGMQQTLVTTVKFLAFGFGPAARSAWIPVALAALGVLVLTAFVLLSQVRSGPATERRRLVGLCLAFAALTALSLAIGLGRAGKVEASGYMSPRYALLSVPMLVTAFLVFEVYASSRVRALAHTSLLLVVLLLLPLNTRFGLKRLDWFERGFEAYRTDLDAGASIEQLADRHHPFLMPWSRDALVSRMYMLREAGLGPHAGTR